jgi:hypothetical protein
MNNTYLVVTGADGKPVHGGARNVKDVPGRWTTRRKKPKMCEHGWHACTPEYLARWCYADQDEYLALAVWECEVENPSKPGLEGKVVGKRRKKTRCLGTLDDVDLRWIAADIACQTLHLTGAPEVSECILTIYRWCAGEANDEELDAASLAASLVALNAASLAASRAVYAVSLTAGCAATYAAYAAAGNADMNEVLDVYGASFVTSYEASSRIILDYLEATYE